MSKDLFLKFWGLLLLTGVILWIMAAVKGRIRPWFAAPGALPPWPIHTSDFLFLPVIVSTLLLLLPYGALRLAGLEVAEPLTGPAMLIGGFATGISYIGGVLLFRIHRPARSHESTLPLSRAALAGLIGLVMFFPACVPVAAFWKILLERVGISTDAQDMIPLILATQDPLQLAGWLLLVVVIAPIGEELIFRANLFRFFANYMPSRVAILVSALLFSLMHLNAVSFVPLLFLGIALALVYEKTGRILAPIVMHAGFNLNTMLAVLSGANS